MSKLSFNDIPPLIRSHYRVDVTLKYLASELERYKEYYDLDLDPPFQRSHVWSEEMQIRFAEYILRDGISPAICFNCPGWMRYYSGQRMVIIDGKQRITALLRFLNDEIRVFRGLKDREEGYLSSEIAHNLSISVPFCVNNLPTRKMEVEWYLQINEGLVAHTPEELQKAKDYLKTL